MRVVFLTELSHTGGVDTFLTSLVRHWPRTDDEIWVLANARHPGLHALAAAIGDRARVEAHGVPVYADRILQMAAGGKGRIRLLAPLLRLGDAVRGYLGFRRLFRRLAPDRVVIVAGGYPGGDSCRIAAITWTGEAKGRPYAWFNVHNLAVPLASWNVLERMIDRILTRSVVAFVAVSRACAESMRARPALWDSGKVGYILNGVEAPAVAADPGALRAELGLQAECPLVLMLATYEPRKGHAFLFMAFKQVLQRMPGARLVVCGYSYPKEINEVEAALRKAGVSDRVSLLGFRQDTARLLAAADVLVVPSQAFESFGLTCVEAMAAGVPVVATRVGGLAEVVADGDGGYSVERDDIKGFADRVARLLENSELRREQAARGKQRYARLFTAERMAQQYAALIGGAEKSAAIIPANLQEPRHQ